MQTTITAHLGKKQVTGWLHRGGSKVLVLLIHSHNSDGTRGRFITLAKELERLGFDCLRYSVARNEVAPGVLEVPTLSEEIQQAKAILGQVRSKYAKVIAAGHSQGGIVALQLVLDGFVDGVVQLMGVVDPAYHVPTKLAKLGYTLDALRSEKIVTLTAGNGLRFGYTAAFFDDFLKWNVTAMLAKNKKPILFIEAEGDDQLKTGEVREGFAAANEPKSIYSVVDRHAFSNENALLIAREIASWWHKTGQHA